MQPSARNAVYRQFVAFLLLVSFGGFGAHRFYLGLWRSAWGMCSLTAVFFLATAGPFWLSDRGFSDAQLGGGLFALPYQTPGFVSILTKWTPVALVGQSRLHDTGLALVFLSAGLIAVLLGWLARDVVAIALRRLPWRRDPAVEFGWQAPLHPKWTAIALLFFVGGFGLHRFYLGRRMSGAILAGVTTVFLSMVVLRIFVPPEVECYAPGECPPPLNHAIAILWGVFSQMLGLAALSFLSAATSADSPVFADGTAVTSIAIGSLFVFNAWLWVDLFLIVSGRLRPADQALTTAGAADATS